MTKREELLSIDTYEEFDKRRNEFKSLPTDLETIQHVSKLMREYRERNGIKVLSTEGYPDIVSDPTPLPKNMIRRKSEKEKNE